MSGQEQVLRTGVLFKKGSGSGPFGRRNWKPRYFVLTPGKLQYYTFEDGDLKGEVDLAGCDENVLEVMPADSMKTGSSASTIWRVAINTPSRRLLVAAGTEMEMNDWVDKLVLAFRISAGLTPMPSDQARASVYAPADARVVVGQGGANPGITDFQNFAAARRSVAVGMNRHSVGSHPGSTHSGGGDVGRHSDVDAVLLVQAEQLHEQQQRQRQEHAAQAAKHREEEDARARAVEAEAAAAAMLAAAADEERREREEAERVERERAQQHQREEQARLEKERVERERVERLAQDEARKKAVQEKLLADELELTQSFKKAEQQEALLELQRRQKREEHERQRRESAQKALEAAALAVRQEEEAAALAAKQEADLIARKQAEAIANEDPLERQRREKREKRERERAERERIALEQEKQQQQRKSEFDDLEFRMTAQLQQSQQQFFDVDNESDSDSDEEYTVGANSLHGGRPSEPERSPPLAAHAERLSSPSSAPPPRSSLIGDVKVETMRKQQAEHQRRREQSLQQEKLKLEMEQQRVQLEAVALSHQQPQQQQHHHQQQQDVTIARGSERGEIEIVRRPMKPASNSPPAARVMESVEF